MTGAQLRHLQGEASARLPGQTGLYLLGAMADHDYAVIYAGRAHLMPDLTQHGAPGRLVQHFGQGGFHARAFAGRHDDSGSIY